MKEINNILSGKSISIKVHPIIVALLLIWFIYQVGYAVGQFLFHITH